MNPVLRSELRYRLGGSRAVAAHTVVLAVLAVLALLALPPDVGREEVRREGLVIAVLVVAAASVTYVASASGCGEIVMNGEKPAWDLAASSLRARDIAAGKVLSAGALAALQTALAAPFLVVTAGLRGDSPVLVGQAAVVIVPVATAAGAAGSLYAALLESDVLRSLAHWTTVGVLFLVPSALPAPWSLAGPVPALSALVREGWRPVHGLVAAGYLAVAAGCGMLLRLRVQAIRRRWVRE
ncbi:MAG: hypothetical protein QN173_06375 [Armatimonadota bacterium]|nr:hypothetical protein [Armatimonadota bacterium]MDR7437034.1 hypothetical protein [Armatimonadota bacterium]MDR7472895.1 hypothetical protein [Armatimonadota bacterium]MDR7507215.1 hypothetical protein [Armatimonadota bacterium]MDR7508920.1 hypothetical protein [Armatimonadota bacterium]